jgi:ATP-dependent Clp protease protease subunit
LAFKKATMRKIPFRITASATTDKIPFRITAVKKGKIAHIDIVGEIGWEVNSKQFMQDVRKLKDEGCTEAFVYINTPGGSCFHANEIVNILTDNFEKITGDGGAIVASAGTYISTVIENFSMPANGQYMLHRPKGCACGTITDIAAYLKMQSDIDKDYFDRFIAKATNKEDFKKKWESGADYWMTAQEAKDAGFIASVREKVKIDKETKNMLRACAENIQDRMTQLLTNDTENMKQLADLLKLKADAVEIDYVNAVTPILNENSTLKSDLQKEKDEKKALQDRINAIEAAEKKDKQEKAEALIVEAIKDGRLADDEKHTSKNFWLKNFEADFEGASAELGKLPKRTDVRSKLADTGSGESAWTKRQREIEEANKK